jgi:hypothetical protein
MRRGVGADEPLINGLPAGSDKVLIGLVSCHAEGVSQWVSQGSVNNS